MSKLYTGQAKKTDTPSGQAEGKTSSKKESRTGKDLSYKSFYEFSPFMYFTVDSSGIVIAANSTSTSGLGFSEEELVGKPVLDVFHPGDRECVAERLKISFDNPGIEYRWEARKVKKDGNVIWVRENAKTIRTESGDGFAKIACEDITEQKMALSMLNIEKKVFESMAGNNPLYRTLELICSEIEKLANGMLCSFLIIDESGKRLRHGAAPSLPEGYVRAIDGSEIGPATGSCGTAAYRKAPVIVTDIAEDPLWDEYRHLALEHSLRACWSIPIISSEDKVLGTFAMYYNEPRAPVPDELVLVDTVVRLATVAIERTTAKEMATHFAEILEEAINEIYIFDAGTFRFLQVNKGARDNLGYTLEELREMTPEDLNPGLTPDFFRKLEPLVHGGREKMRFNCVHRRKNGTKYPVEAYMQLSNYKGLRVFVANVIDMTDLKKTEEELKQHVERLSKKSRYESIIRAVTESVHRSLDLGEVFDNAVDALNRNVEGATNVVIFMVEGTDAVMKANRGHSARYVKRVKRVPYPVGATWKTILDRKARYVSDTDLDQTIGPAGKEFGTKSYLSMPIWSDNRTVGCIHIHSQEKDAFSVEDLDMLQIVARQLEVAINNAKQAEALRKSEEDIKQKLGELSKKKRYEEILSAITRSVHSSINLDQVMENAVDTMHRSIEGTDFISIYFAEGNEAVIKAHCGYPEWFTEKMKRIPHPLGFTWKTIIEGEDIYCPDIESDTVIGAAGREAGTKSYASMPIKHMGNTIGCININSLRKNAFDEEELNLLKLIASQIEIAVNNAKHAEALKESEERYRTLFEQTPVGVYTYGQDLVITQTNERHAEIMQSSKEKITGLDIHDLTDKSFNEIHEKAVRGESASREGFYRSTTGGVSLYIMVSTAPLRDASGNIIGGMSVVEDMTERKKVEIAFLQSQQQYENLVNTVDGIVWEAEPESFRFTFVSRQVERILGYTAEEWLGNDGFWTEKLHPEDRERVVSYCKTSTESLRDHVIEYRMIAADGRVVWMRDIVSVGVEDGKATGLKGIMIDITDLKKAEDLLFESAERYRTLVENNYDIIVESSEEGKFLYLSPNFRESLGYDPDELLGKSMFGNVHPDDTPNVMKEFSRIIATRSPGKTVFRHRHRNGTWRWLESSGRAFETAAGELRYVGIFRDITDRKRYEDELFKAEKLESLGVLAGGIAHDFNNLLTVILGNISVSKMHLKSSDRIYTRLTEAENASLRARDLTSQLLTFSKGGAPVKEYVHTLGDLIRDTASFAVSGSKVRCDFDIADDLWPAEVDGGQISQVIHNLVINSDQAMPDGGVITVSAANTNGKGPECGEDGNYIKISIADSGIGMTEDLVEKIFDPYFTTKQKGSGLGLATVYSIVKNHDGSIDVESEIGVGTKFDVYLPAAARKAAHMDGESGLRNGEGKILIMDDEETVRQVAGDMMKRLGYRVEAAADGQEAITKYLEAKEAGEPFDAVMFDLTVPGGMGGKEAFTRLLEIDPGVRAVVSSGYSNDPVMAKYDEYGFKGVVTKPYSIEELSRVLYEVLIGED
ncbi:MAG TPA: PAS domain S-box protein [Thermodesulfobacteriota bacterium]|nr:PAS domain S-box protein [Thermodesulfobacteriota bacterium]